MVKNDRLKSISTAIYVVAFACGILLFTNRTYGYAEMLKVIFYASGGIALLLSFINSKINAAQTEFNVLFWIGALLLFVGLILKTLHFNYFLYVIGLGMIVSIGSYFYNPNQQNNADNNDLLDH